MPYHRLGGILILLLTFTSAMLGYSEKAAWACMFIALQINLIPLFQLNVGPYKKNFVQYYFLETFLHFQWSAM